MSTLITTDVSDGNSSSGIAYGELYKIATDIGAGTTLTRVHCDLTWQAAWVATAVSITSETWTAAYPYNVALQLGPTGFSPVVLTRANYGNAAFIEITSSPAGTSQSVLLPGTTDNLLGYQTQFAFDWVGELYQAAAWDLYLQTYAGHQASPQLQFQQAGTANVWYG